MGMWIAPGMAPPSLISVGSRTSTRTKFLLVSSFFFNSGIGMRSAAITRDDTLPRRMIHNWMRMLLAVLLGNLAYLIAQPYLPDVLKHRLYALDAGLAFDFLICLGI